MSYYFTSTELCDCRSALSKTIHFNYMIFLLFDKKDILETEFYARFYDLYVPIKYYQFFLLTLSYAAYCYSGYYL